MKNYFLCIAALLCFFAASSSAQRNNQRYNQRYGKQAQVEKLNTVALDYGFFSTVNLSLYLGSSIANYFIDEYGENIEHTGHSVLGPTGISYMRKIRRFEIGASAWYSSHALKFSGYQYGSPAVRTYGLLFDANFIYLDNPNISLYSGISLGPGYIKIANVVDEAILKKIENYLGTAYIASHINLFGIRYGKDFGVTLESGFGHKGLVHFGVDYRF